MSAGEKYVMTMFSVLTYAEQGNFTFLPDVLTAHVQLQCLSQRCGCMRQH